ncbi:receptor-type tyrosine-protein phosphatase eta-like [Brachyistius frenatus]|uniref:receptor-type tyrosine-protein phosphatase eta-like n=1 Tax=Brachyistius frenatus TaxID=100188 RepID=UPI0037E9725B
MVTDLRVINFTTSSVYLNWTKPKGNSSSYKVQRTDGDVANDVKPEEYTITGLTPGVHYQVNVTAVADDNYTEGATATVSQYTKPGVVRNLTVTDFSTSSVSLTWIEPVGNSSFYTVQWSDGNVNQNRSVNNTHVTISQLTAGSQYNFSVIAVAGEKETFGEAAAVSLYTKPEVVRNLSVTDVTTSSICLKWIDPERTSSFYRVQWTDGTTNLTDTVTETTLNVTKLTPGVRYHFTVIAVAGDNFTESEKAEIYRYTKPGVVRNLTVTDFSTSSVSLTWIEPVGNSSFYTVQWSDGNVNQNRSVNNTHVTISQLTAGSQYNFSVIAVAGEKETFGEAAAVSLYTSKMCKLCWCCNLLTLSYSCISLYITSIYCHLFTFASTSGTHNPQTTAVAGDNKTEGTPFNFTSVTKPSPVRNLTLTSVETCAVSLNWTEPQGYADFYIIQWNTGKLFNRTETSFTIQDLIPGSQYTIIVTAVAVEPSNKGEGSSITTFTKPEKPGNITATPQTNALTVNWTLPKGSVDYYLVTISNPNLTLKVNTTTANFDDLNPGRIFVITVTAVAGNFRNTSDESLFATVPMPPPSIIIGHRDNSSLQLMWTTPTMMESAPNINYHITYQTKEGAKESVVSTGNNTTLDELLSGTCYNITIKTVGPLNLSSIVVHNSTFTYPNPVMMVEASPKSTTSITVTWSDPLGVQPYYKYIVEIVNATGASSFQTVSNNVTDVTNLEPGSRYDINVTTQAAPGSESNAEQTFAYTMPNAVTNLTVEFMNTTAIQLTWFKQNDHKPSYSYLVTALKDGKMVCNGSTKTETYTFYNLDPGTLYMFNVVTDVQGVKSIAENISNYTKPGVPCHITVTGTTTNLSVSWMPAPGQVSSYSVLVYREMQLVDNITDLSNVTVNALFQSLKPAVHYCVMVTSKSGPFESNSSWVCNATFPNPPGPITVVSQTVHSINFTWSLPEDMDPNQYNFTVNSTESLLPAINWILLDNLQSGSPYNISVVTVGVLGYKSTEVTAENYTRPFAVTNLRQTEITTNAVTLVWEQPESKLTYSYEVLVTNNSFPNLFQENMTTITITELVSGSNFSFTVTTRAADGTRAGPVTVSYFTRPNGVEGLEAETLNTTAILLRWMKPLEYRNEYTYWVKTTGCASQNKTLTGEMAEILELTAGTDCTFCVSVIGADGIKGKENCISQYTKPEKVQPSISSQGSNSSVLVSWTKPPGNVEWYKVHLQPNHREVKLNSTSTFFLCEGLSAGRLYSAVVITCSGPFNASSETITNATFPNPPGLIEIVTKTTSSIEFKWMEPPLMTGASFSYLLTKILSFGGENIQTNTANNTNYTFSSLLPGTSFNISVATLGLMGFESGRVYKYIVTTRPLNVSSITTDPKEMNIMVIWNKPDEYKESYSYILTWQRSDNPVSNSTILKNTMHNIGDLDPGSSYNISVTIETFDGTQSAPRWTSDCTNASPVKDLSCDGPNKTNAEIILSWTKPRGQNSGFQVIVNEIIHSSNTCCSHTVSNLRHHTKYNLTVKTKSCGYHSTPLSVNCLTGITSPPIPDNQNTLSSVVQTKYNSFSLQVDSSLQNNSNGPITHVGVLVANSVHGETKNLSQYLGNTYDEWKAGNTPVYLAMVTDNIVQPQRSQDHLIIYIGNGSEWNGYTNGALEPKGKYQYAIAIFTSLKLKQGRVDFPMSLVSITNFYFVVELPQNTNVIGIAIGVTFGIFSILAIILIGFIIYWKRLSNKESPDIQIHSMRAKVSVAVRVEEYEAYYKKQKADSNCGFAEEFEDLKLVGTAQSKIHALNMENKPKNRYNNVLPYDSSRVKLSITHGSPYDDYINANYMPGYISRKEFIAAQGPLPTTVDEFWRMIWEKNVQTLVMLTRCNEQGRVKCEQYWGSGTKHFDEITVTTTSEIPLEDWTIRDFGIKNVKTAETRSVRHFHFTAWPDHRVPETTELLISFRHLVREHMNQYSRHSPTVVHCSAGVGRTGTFIAIDRLIFQIERENIVDVYGIVHDLRMHRTLMVQTEDQYVFLNQCALDIIRSRTGTNVDLIYQNAAALSIYENVEPKKGPKGRFHNA